jgi:hypothetical protein
VVQVGVGPTRAQLVDYNHDDIDAIIEVSRQLRRLTTKGTPGIAEMAS